MLEARTSSLLLNDERTCFLGTLNGPVRMASPAAILIVGVDESFRLKEVSSGEEQEHSIALIPPELKIGLDANKGRLLVVFLDLLKQDYLSLSGGLELEGSFFGLDGRYVSLIRESITSAEKEVSPERSIRDIFSLLDSWRNESLPKDERVQRVAELIKSDIASNLNVEALAEQVFLSVPQLHHIFRRQTGITLRKYRIWRRIFIAMGSYGVGASLTDAAQYAGFTDASHFIRAFKEVYGTSPRKLLAHTESLEIVSDK